YYMGRVDEASTYLYKSVEMFDKMGEIDMSLASIMAIAGIHITGNDGEKGMAINKKYYPIAKERGLKEIEAFLLYNIGIGARTMLQYDTALHYLNLSIPLFDTISNFEQQSLAYANMA